MNEKNFMDKDQLEKNIDELEDEINENIDELLSMVKNEPIQLLTTIALSNAFIDPENYSEANLEVHEPYIEYAQSLALSYQNPSFRDDLEDQTNEKFEDLISSTLDKVFWYFGFNTSLPSFEDVKAEIRFTSLMNFLIVRGDSYPHHRRKLLKDLFTPHDEFLKKNFDITAEELVNLTEAIPAKIQKKVNDQYEQLSILKELHELWQDFTDGLDLDNYSSEEEIIKEFHQLSEVKKKKNNIDEIPTEINSNPFKIDSLDVPDVILDKLSATFGNNKNFRTFEKTPAWPTNNSVIYKKPFIKHNGDYYCFIPQLLTRNLKYIVENWIKNEDSEYFNRHQKRRSKLLENETISFFEDLLPTAETYTNLCYTIVEDGEEKLVETDGIVIYDRNLFIIEAKSGEYSLSARRGSLKRIKQDLEDTIDEAYSQAIRTKEYIEEKDEAVFKEENGSEALRIRSDAFDNIYLINTTLEGISFLLPQLNSLRKFDLIQGREWPWTVFINDLRVVKDLIETPSEFLLYLKRRLKANDFPQFKVFDELDFLLYFFEHGLYLEEGIPEDADILQPVGYTENLDKYYYSKMEDSFPKTEKPSFQIEQDYRDLITEIENTQKDGFSKVTTSLLSFDAESQEKILELLEKQSNKVKKDGKSHDFSMLFEEMDKGVTFCIYNKIPEGRSKINKYGKLNLQRFEVSDWIVILYGIKEDEWDFELY